MYIIFSFYIYNFISNECSIQKKLPLYRRFCAYLRETEAIELIRQKT